MSIYCQYLRQDQNKVISDIKENSVYTRLLLLVSVYLLQFPKTKYVFDLAFHDHNS